MTRSHGAGSKYRLFSKDNLPYLILGLIGCVLILVCPHIPNNWIGYQYIRPLAEGLGSSFIIATIMIYTVEVASRRRQEESAHAITDRIAKDVFQAIYKKYIPTAIFKEVEDCLLHSNIHREDFTIDCKLETIEADRYPAHLVPENHDQYFSLHSHNYYKLINNTDQDITHEITTFVELPLDDRWFQFVNIKGVRINGIELDDDKIAHGTFTKADKSALGFRHKVQLSPFAEITVSISYHTVKQKVDMEVWSTREPTNRLKLKVSAPENVTIQATSNHSTDLESLKGGLPGCCEWNLNAGIFPHQSVIFWWHQA